MPTRLKRVFKISLKMFSTMLSWRTHWLFLKRSVQDFFHIGGEILSIVNFSGWGERSLFISEEVDVWIGCRVVSQRVFGRNYWFFYYFLTRIVDRVGVEDRISFLMLKCFNSLKTRCIPLKPMKTILIPFRYFDWIGLIKFFLLKTFFLYIMVILFVDWIHNAG